MKSFFSITKIVFVCVLALAQLADNSHALTLNKVVVALKPDKNPDAMLQEKSALSGFLSAKLGKPVEVIVPLAGAVILEGFSNGTIDLGYLSGVDMVNAADKGAASALLVGEINGKNYYESYWLSLKEKPYARIEDLKGKPVAFSSKTSTSGYLVPHWDLVKKGLLSDKADPEAFFGKGNTWYGTGYVSAIERVLNGDAEAAAVSDYVLLKDKHLTSEQKDKLKIVAKQGPVPTHIIAVRKSVSDADRTELKAAILSLNEEANTALRDKMFTSKLIEANEASHVQTVREALALVGKGK